MRIPPIGTIYAMLLNLDQRINTVLLANGQAETKIPKVWDFTVPSVNAQYSYAIQYAQYARDAQVRSRARWVEEGEVSSSYFFRLEKKRSADRWISAVRNDDGTIVSSPDELCRSFSHFNISLFTAAGTDQPVQSDMLGNLSSVLSQDEALSCEGHLPIEEVFVALQGMARYVKFKTWSLQAQWVKRFASSPSGWATFLNHPPSKKTTGKKSDKSQKPSNPSSAPNQPSNPESVQTVLRVTEENEPSLPCGQQVNTPIDEIGTAQLFENTAENERSESWAETAQQDDDINENGAAPPPLLEASGGDLVVEVPSALSQLENVGVRFKRTPNNWKFNDDESAKLFKGYSVKFSVDTVCTSQDILFGFDAAGIDIDHATPVQRKNSNTTWVVSFDTPENKAFALELNSVTISGCEVFLGDAEHQTVIVKIYEAPPEMPDTVLIGRLSQYGKILSFRRDRLGVDLENGVRTARMRVAHPIPASMRICGELIMFYYDSQPKSCRRCGGNDHIAKIAAFF
ncbi:hypothetical protein ACROYT_G003939 [Oculina patagonica]